MHLLSRLSSQGLLRRQLQHAMDGAQVNVRKIFARRRPELV